MSENPLHPYDWEATYHDGRRLRRESPGGPWREQVPPGQTGQALPIRGLHRLAVLGHPDSPLTIEVPAEASLDGVVLRLRGTLAMASGGVPTHTRRWGFGVRQGDRMVGFVIQESGAVRRYAGPPGSW